ncbi:MAG: hypothetical protein IKG90_03630 [Bacteroidales bacterium]|nr:hypothetical protein [Bacteroidales bacterium]
MPEAVTVLIEQMAERAAEAGDDGYGGAAGMEALVRYYEQLLRQPLNLNAATRLQLEETGLLTLFQLESLFAWRERYGAVRSATEWALVEGFSPETVARLQPFFSLGDPAERQQAAQTYTAKFRKKWKQAGFSLTTKAQYESQSLSLSAVLDNDPKERFPDFISLSARYNGFYAGDFTARFGQGLVLWKSFSLTAFGTPSAASRRGGGLQAYHSTDESNFFRGVGWSGGLGRPADCSDGLGRPTGRGRLGQWTMSAFISRNAVDARLVDGRYTSIATDGLHVSETEKAKRHTMHEYVAGGNVTLTRGRWRFGVTGVAYAYDHPNGRKVQDYNRYQQYDGLWGNLGADVYGSLGSLRVFGEAAVDAHGAPAVLAGALWSPSYEFETSLTFRCYAPSYIATHAGAYTSLSSVSNQVGGAWAAQLIQGRWTLRANADLAWYPWKRYRQEAGTWGFNGRIQLLRSFTGGAEAEVQLAWSSRLKGRLRLSLPAGDAWQLTVRSDANLGGAAGYADVRWRPSRRWDLSARMTLWRTRDWDSRICFYERGVPQSFLVENYAGKGIGAYLVAKYAPTRNVEMWVKLQQGYAAYFVRIFIPG